MAALKITPGQLVAKRKCMSIVWRYFRFTKEDVEQREVLCRSCRRIVPARTGNTTNLFNHLEKHHKVLFEESQAIKKSKTGTSSFHDKQKQGRIDDAFSSIMHQEITDAITSHIAKDMLPVYSVTKEGFKKMIRTLDKRYKIPPRNYLSGKAIPKLYNETKTRVDSELRDVDYFATRTDLWSSRTTEPYMSLSAHFITKNFELKTRCLQTSFFPRGTYWRQHSA